MMKREALIGALSNNQYTKGRKLSERSYEDLAVTSVTAKNNLKSINYRKDSEHPHRRAAQDAGISHNTYAKIKYLVKTATRGEKKQLESGEVSVDRIYKDVKKREQKTVGFPSDDKYKVFYCDPYLRDFSSPSGWRFKRFITKPEYLPITESKFFESTIFMWSPSHFLEKSLTLMKSWGFEYEGMLIWKLKEPIESHQIVNSHVMILVGTSGGGVPNVGFKPLSLIEDSGKGSRHDQVRDIIDKMYKEGKKLELLAHEKKEGWDLFTGEGAA